MFIGTWADGQFMEGKWVSDQGTILPGHRSIQLQQMQSSCRQTQTCIV